MGKLTMGAGFVLIECQEPEEKGRIILPDGVSPESVGTMTNKVVMCVGEGVTTCKEGDNVLIPPPCAHQQVFVDPEGGGAARLMFVYKQEQVYGIVG